jgi:uncharacterized membrane protein YdbT with pleckstrin-like domain
MDEENYKIIRPKIVPLIILIKSIIPSFFLIFVMLVYFINMSKEIPTINTLINFLIIFIIFTIISYFLQILSLKKTIFNFYSDRIEYFEGFLVKNKKTLYYDRITNVGQQEGILERMFGLGSVYFDTAGSSAKGHELMLSYLEESDKYYDYFINKMKSKDRNNF